MQHVPSKILDIDCSWQFIVLYLIKKDTYHFIIFFPAEISYSYLNPSLLSYSDFETFISKPYVTYVPHTRHVYVA